MVPPHRVRRHKGLGLRRHWCEDALLLKTLAVSATTILRLVKARATDLIRVSFSSSPSGHLGRIPCVVYNNGRLSPSSVAGLVEAGRATEAEGDTDARTVEVGAETDTGQGAVVVGSSCSEDLEAKPD